MWRSAAFDELQKRQLVPDWHRKIDASLTHIIANRDLLPLAAHQSLLKR